MTNKHIYKLLSECSDKSLVLPLSIAKRHAETRVVHKDAMLSSSIVHYFQPGDIVSFLGSPTEITNPYDPSKKIIMAFIQILTNPDARTITGYVIADYLFASKPQIRQAD